MEIKDIPQDDSPIFRGQTKVIYATEKGHYQKSTTTGWQDETFATQLAVDALATQAKVAYEQCVCGQYSPLYFRMYQYRYDVSSLAQATGFFQWQIKRHFQPAIFNRLPEKKLRKYLAAFQLSLFEFTHLPDHHAL
ncbi:hypothetical protein [Snodgrassella sp. CFCC 13594]|uniref:hypothetical protein n=1 Tax=Snodgrassella sp. CFCC 13594 TaxID=1775559 RepID=UPI00082BDCC9|nr:hypothetical protein [Snodgrassella sp. CFCC 13594]